MITKYRDNVLISSTKLEDSLSVFRMRPKSRSIAGLDTPTMKLPKVPTAIKHQSKASALEYI